MKPSVSLLLTVFSFISIATVGYAGLTPGHWCGKPYGAIRHAPVSPTPDINPNPPVINTTLPGFGVQFRYQPYLSTDTTGSLVVNVPAKGNYTIKAALADGTILLPATPVTATDLTQEIKNVNLALVKPQLTAYYTTITFSSGGTIVQKSIVRLYRLPSGPKTVKVDRLYGGIIPANMKTPIFPWFPYIDFGWIIGGKGMEANLKALKAIGYNSINPDPTWTNVTQVDQMLQICEQLGIYVQISFRYDFTDTQTVISNVKRWMASNAVLTWYSTDEPDGTEWISNKHTTSAYKAIRATDPYRPVSLVLNCQLSAGYYTDASDIYGTDVYPIGISTKGCNATTGDCGCDFCEGSLTKDIISRTNRYRSDYAAQGVQSIPVWMVLQAFLDPGSWWKRSPTPEEFTVMFWLSIIEGYKAIGFWQYPYLPKYKPLHEVLSTQLSAVGPSQILASTQLPASHIAIKGTGANSTLFASAWFSAGSSLLFVVVNANPVLTTFTVTATDAKAISGSGKEVVSGAAVTLKDGAVSGKLEALSAGIYTFHLGSKAA